MAASIPVMRYHELHARARQLAAGSGRVLLGITRAPGAGKSTLARAIISAAKDRARLVEMDGFHLAQSPLTALGHSGRKGAPCTFDAAGFLTMIRRLREPGQHTIYAPEFRRDLEEPIAAALPVEPHITLIVIEGNYLLLPEEPWAQLRDLIDEIWYCESDEQTRLNNLIARHRAYGKSDQDARNWALGPDQKNAELIYATRSHADVIARPRPPHPVSPRPGGR
jgi:pantothenate kinase